jgi:hypothetical protein
MIVCLVDIGGIDDHQLFKLSFHVMIINVYTLILQYVLICTLVFRGANRLFGRKRYNDACTCFKDRKSLQRIVYICTHTQIFRRVCCLIVACGDV